MAKFSERLRELRKERGLKQREMAEICGLKLRGYQQYEYNESYPEVPGLVALADFFGVSLDYLMGRSDKREISRGPPPKKTRSAPPLVIKWNETLL